MTHALALALVACAGVFLVALGLAALLRPRLARTFLLGFAASPTKHYMELAVRFAVGCALVLASPALPGAMAFSLFGWVLLATTSLMLFIPWRKHRAFAQVSVPKALRYLPAVGLASLAAGVGTLWAVTSAGAGAA
jgi:hypothetical protein